MSIIAILVFIAMMGVGIYLTAIYALPTLAGIAAYALLNQIDASAPTIAIGSIASGLAALAAARVGAAAHNEIVRLATLAIIAAPAGYAAYCATLQLARLFAVPEEWWTMLSAIAAFVGATFALDRIGELRLANARSRLRHRFDSAYALDGVVESVAEVAASEVKGVVGVRGHHVVDRGNSHRQ